MPKKTKKKTSKTKTTKRAAKKVGRKPAKKKAKRAPQEPHFSPAADSLPSDDDDADYLRRLLADGAPRRWQVSVCNIKGPHSHTEALMRRVKEK